MLILAGFSNEHALILYVYLPSYDDADESVLTVSFHVYAYQDIAEKTSSTIYHRSASDSPLLCMFTLALALAFWETYH